MQNLEPNWQISGWQISGLANIKLTNIRYGWHFVKPVERRRCWSRNKELLTNPKLSSRASIEQQIEKSFFTLIDQKPKTKSQQKRFFWATKEGFLRHQKPKRKLVPCYSMKKYVEECKCKYSILIIGSINQPCGGSFTKVLLFTKFEVVSCEAP